MDKELVRRRSRQGALISSVGFLIVVSVFVFAGFEINNLNSALENNTNKIRSLESELLAYQEMVNSLIKEINRLQEPGMTPGTPEDYIRPPEHGQEQEHETPSQHEEPERERTPDPEQEVETPGQHDVPEILVEPDPDWLAWQTADSINTINSYSVYMRNFPNGQYVSQARDRINRLREEEERQRQNEQQRADNDAWRTANSINTINSYSDYLRNFPNGQYVSQARDRINRLREEEERQQTRKSNSGSFTDSRDGKTYKWIQTGNQVWMAENLAFNPNRGNYWAYDNNIRNVRTYGYLYDWVTALEACPAGWRLPDDNEWRQLINFVGRMSRNGGDPATKLKAGRGWRDNGNGTDDFGFSALPGGGRLYRETFQQMGYSGIWWSATEINNTEAWYWLMNFDRGDVNRTGTDKKSGLSVRCISDN